MSLFRKQSPVEDERFLPSQGIINARDIGGYRMQDGRVVRKGRLLRGATLSSATDEDIKLLMDFGTVKVFDFRSDFEKRGKLDRTFPSAQFIDLPISTFDPADAPPSVTRGKSFDLKKVIMIAAFNEQAQKSADRMYPILVEQEGCQRQFAAFLRMVVDTPDGAVFFHCTQGKDRTGLAAAYLLSALGASRETVIEDFDLTNRVYERDLKKFSRRVKLLGGGEPALTVIRSFIGANTENFVKALEDIDRKYGSMHAYLTGPLGLTDYDMEILKERYLVKGEL